MADSKERRGELQLAIKDSINAAIEESERVHVIITTYDMARPKDDGKFLRSLHADVSPSTLPLRHHLQVSGRCL